MCVCVCVCVCVCAQIAVRAARCRASASPCTAPRRQHSPLELCAHATPLNYPRNPRNSNPRNPRNSATAPQAASGEISVALKKTIICHTCCLICISRTGKNNYVLYIALYVSVAQPTRSCCTGTRTRGAVSLYFLHNAQNAQHCHRVAVL